MARRGRCVSAMCCALLLASCGGNGGSGGGYNLSKIAFSSQRNGYAQIYVMNGNGSGQARLTNDDFIDFYPTWSPDGSEIAYEHWPPLNDTSVQIFVTNADGSGAHSITADPSWIDAEEPVWSPDGTKIAISASTADHSGIFWIAPDGSSSSVIVSGIDTEPTWSPDSTKMAFDAYISTPGFNQIQVIGIDGSNRHALTPPTQDATDPSWSPDGTRILYTVNGADGSQQIYVMDADGSNEVPLTDKSSHNYSARWSPDGKAIVFGSDRTGHSQVFVMSASGGIPHNLTNTDSDEGGPTVRPN